MSYSFSFDFNKDVYTSGGMLNDLTNGDISYKGITPGDDYLHNNEWLTMLRSFNLQQQQNILNAWRKERRRIRLKNIYQLWPTQTIQIIKS